MLKYNPARLVAAVGVLMQSIILLAAYAFHWEQELIFLVEGVQTAALGVGTVLFVEAKSVSIEGLNDYADAVAVKPNPPVDPNG